MTYHLDKSFSDIGFSKDQMNFQEYESCVFTKCNFSDCIFSGVTLVDCTFIRCNFEGSIVAHTAFRNCIFNNCSFRDVNFSMADKLIFEVHFIDCNLDFAKFYALKFNASTFTDCSLIAADFMSANLKKIAFDGCDLYRAEFDGANLMQSDFSSSRHFTIDPEKTKITGAVFSRENVKGLLTKYALEIT